MLMQEATPEMIEQWKSIWNEYKDKLCSNRKSGAEVVQYIAEKYPLRKLYDEKAEQVVIGNVLLNKPLAEKLPKGKQPSPVTFIIENIDEGKQLYREQNEIFDGSEIFVGIDLESGFFCVEGSSLLWDELYAFQGLDEMDIQNYFCVAQYISALKRFQLLDNVLS